MKNLIQTLLIALLLMSSCTSSIFEDGTLSPLSYRSTIDFETRQGLIIIKLDIGGINYDFLLDSGAITIVSEEVANSLHFQPEFFSDYTDSKDRSFSIGFGHSDLLKIGDVSYTNIGIGVTNFSALNSISCLNVDGIIGSNLMQKSIWEIDYINEEITITDAISQLDIPNDAFVIPFTADNKGEAYIDLVVDNQKVSDVEIDLGSRYDFQITKQEMKQFINSDAPRVQGFGYGSAGFTGYADPDEEIVIAKSSLVSISQMNVEGALIHLINTGGSKVGNLFLSQYDVVIDWLNKNLYLTPADITTAELSTYGISPIYNEGKPRVGMIYDLQNNALSQLKADDIITSVNGTDCSSVSKEEWCVIANQIANASKEELQITIFSNEKPLSISLPKVKAL